MGTGWEGAVVDAGEREHGAISDETHLG
jgi:hypothetical protein